MGDVLITFFGSMLVGALVAAPIGPVSMLCIRYTLSQGLICGLIVVLGASSGDMIYTSIIGFGMDGASQYLSYFSKYIKTVGGGFLIYLGIKSLLSNDHKKEDAASLEGQKNFSKKGDSKKFIFIISFITTAISPMTVLLFLSLFTAIGISGGGILNGLIIVLGAFLGTSFWLFGMELGILFFKEKFSDILMRNINFISGVALVIFGILSTTSAFK